MATVEIKPESTTQTGGGGVAKRVFTNITTPIPISQIKAENKRVLWDSKNVSIAKVVDTIVDDGFSIVVDDYPVNGNIEPSYSFYSNTVAQKRVQKIVIGDKDVTANHIKMYITTSSSSTNQHTLSVVVYDGGADDRPDKIILQPKATTLNKNSTYYGKRTWVDVEFGQDYVFKAGKTYWVDVFASHAEVVFYNCVDKPTEANCIVYHNADHWQMDLTRMNMYQLVSKDYETFLDVNVNLDEDLAYNGVFYEVVNPENITVKIDILNATTKTPLCQDVNIGDAITLNPKDNPYVIYRVKLQIIDTTKSVANFRIKTLSFICDVPEGQWTTNLTSVPTSNNKFFHKNSGLTGLVSNHAKRFYPTQWAYNPSMSNENPFGFTTENNSYVSSQGDYNTPRINEFIQPLPKTYEFKRDASYVYSSYDVVGEFYYSQLDYIEYFKCHLMVDSEIIRTIDVMPLFELQKENATISGQDLYLPYSDIAKRLRIPLQDGDKFNKVKLEIKTLTGFNYAKFKFYYNIHTTANYYGANKFTINGVSVSDGVMNFRLSYIYNHENVNRFVAGYIFRDSSILKSNIIKPIILKDSYDKYVDMKLFIHIPGKCVIPISEESPICMALYDKVNGNAFKNWNFVVKTKNLDYVTANQPYIFPVFNFSINYEGQPVPYEMYSPTA